MAKANLLSHTTQRLSITISTLQTHLHSSLTLHQLHQIHSQMLTSSLINDTFASSLLLRHCCNSHPTPTLTYTRALFDHIKHPNSYIYNTMMKIYNQAHHPKEALSLYTLMLQKSVEIDNYTLPIVIQACSIRISPKEGQEVHTHVVKTGFSLDLYVQNNLVSMYSVLGSLGDARQAFDEIFHRDLVSWNSMLGGYTAWGSLREAVSFFHRMPQRSVISWNSMISLSSRCGRVSEARRFFDRMYERDLVSWGAMISCYEQNEKFIEALKLFRDMGGEGIGIDEIVLVSVLSACASLEDLREGESIHGQVIKVGFECYVSLGNTLIHFYAKCGCIEASRVVFDGGTHLDSVSWNALISGYVKCGALDEAKRLFDAMVERDEVSWGTMISGYVQQGQYQEALALFRELQLEGNVALDEATLVSVASTCAHMCAIDQGKWVHAYARKNKMSIIGMLGTSIIDMYAKCGCIESALEVFDTVKERSVSTWNAIIVGLAVNGWIDKCFKFFSLMKESGVAPNEITFVGVLSACRHAGLVEEGRHHFESMKLVYNIEPNVKHYGCMVDLLGRVGFLEEAWKVISIMPVKPDVATWGALLGACKSYGEVVMGEKAWREIIQLEPHHIGSHVLMSNLYANLGRWKDVIGVREKMKQLGVERVPGCSSIEANGVVHEFVAGDMEHPQAREINSMLDEIERRLRLQGYKPDTSQVSLDIDEEEKEAALYKHSEKIAMAFGLLSTNHPTPIRIVKNLRICGDCHSAAKLMSRAFDREIVVRDRHRFHHFKQGSCSCKDYW